MNPRNAIPVLLVALAAAAAVAPGASAQDGEVREHTIYLHENPLHIAPDQINARVGDTLRVTVVNGGASPHNLVFCGDPASPIERCDERWAFTGNIEGGASATLTVDVKEAGEFNYFCDIPGHKSGGMNGRLVVQGEPEKKSVDAAPFALVVLAAAAAALVLVHRR